MRWLLAIAIASCAPRTRIVVIPMACESRLAQPAIRCESELQLNYDGCRWACRLEPQEQSPAHLTFDFGGYQAAEAVSP